MKSLSPILFVAFCCMLGSGFFSRAVAEPENRTGSPCIGYNPELDLWAWEANGSGNQRFCSRNYAFFGLDRVSEKHPPAGRNIPAIGDCCKLSSDDILTDEHLIAPESCPPDYVATGGVFEKGFRRQAASSFRCTKINTRRYQLGPPVSGVVWGVSSYAALRFVENRRIMKRAIPLALRYGIGRGGRTEWSDAGCISWPPGGLLTEKLGRHCRKSMFRELQYRGAPGDPSAGTPVKMFPDCSDISDIFDRDAQCLP